MTAKPTSITTWITISATTMRPVMGANHEAGLRILTVRGIVAFLAVCGWVGVALTDLGVQHAADHLHLPSSAVWAAMLLVAVLLRAATKMQQSGNLDIRNAIGVTGEVYIPIPEGGKGKVTLILQERFSELDAMCPSGALKTGVPVKVTDVLENGTLIVTPLQ